MIIRTRFLIIFLVTAIIPLIVLTTFTLISSQKAITKKTTENVQNISAYKESRVRLFINSYADEVTLIASRPTLIEQLESYNKTKDPSVQRQMHDYLDVVQKTLEKTKSISILDNQGKIIASTDAALIGQFGRQGAASVAFLLPNNELPAVSIKKPIIVGTATIGSIEFIDQGEQLATIAQNYTGLGKTGDVLFVRYNSETTIDVSSSRFKGNDPQQEKLRSQLAAPQIAQALKDHAKNSSGRVTNASGSFFYTLKYLPNFDVAIVTKIDTSEVLQAAHQLRDSVLVFSLIFIVFVILVILYFVHSVTGPIAHLAVIAKRVAGGDTSQRALVLSGDEIGSLAATFNHMLDELQEARNTLEQKVAQRTEQLEVTNKELESFSYSVSHDLRAPLRAIDGFSKILLEDYADKIDADGRHVVQTIVNSTQQMGALIDDLLAFSRLGRQDVKRQPVDMKRLAKDVFEELKVINSGRNIHLTIKDLPEAYVDASLMHQVWVNLLSNAIKFTRQRKVANIEIGATVGAHSITYHVQDNGAGFDMAFVDKLFGVFQRLHDQKDFEGTGVGLAITKRIVTRHGGKVWAEGKIDAGATMYFTLPKGRKHKKKGVA